MVYRKIHGIIIEIFVEEFLDTGIGFLSKKYSSQQINPNISEIYFAKSNVYLKISQKTKAKSALERGI